MTPVIWRVSLIIIVPIIFVTSLALFAALLPAAVVVWVVTGDSAAAEEVPLLAPHLFSEALDDLLERCSKPRS